MFRVSGSSYGFLVAVTETLPANRCGFSTAVLNKSMPKSVENMCLFGSVGYPKPPFWVPLGYQGHLLDQGAEKDAKKTRKSRQEAGFLHFALTHWEHFWSTFRPLWLLWACFCACVLSERVLSVFRTGFGRFRSTFGRCF